MNEERQIIGCPDCGGYSFYVFTHSPSIETTRVRCTSCKRESIISESKTVEEVEAA